MSHGNETQSGWKARARRELFEYWITALYLALYLGAFMGYRRLLMAEYHIHYAHYGFALIQALVLAKVILIGDVVGVGRRLREDRPLIYITLFRAARFTLWVAFFTILEHMVEGLVRGEGLMGGINELLSQGKFELLASSLVIFFSFMPFFAFRELNRVLGQHTIWNLFFRHYGPRNAATGPGPASGTVPGTTEYEL